MKAGVNISIKLIFSELVKVNPPLFYFTYCNRIVEKSGIINIEEDSIYWEKVSNYEVSQNLFDRILKVGTIKLWSVGGENEPEVVIKKVSQVKKIRFLLDKLIQRR